MLNLCIGKDAGHLHRSTDEPIASHIGIGLVSVVAVLGKLVGNVRFLGDELACLVDAALVCLGLPVDVGGHFDFRPDLSRLANIRSLESLH